jgi:hypothetical protein
MMMPDLRKLLTLVAGMALLLTAVPLPARAYVLMGEHILDLTVKALGPAETLEASQTLTISAPAPAPPGGLQETVRIRRPFDLRADARGEDYERHLLIVGPQTLLVVNGIRQEGPLPRYLRYHAILMAKSRPALVDHLRTVGVDVQVSSLGRLDDRYCYVVGAHFPNEDVAQLWVDKDTFLPFRLLLPSSALHPEAGPLEIRYRNWTFVDGAAYPMHVVMMQNHQVMEEVRVDRVEVNPALGGDVFDMAALRWQWSRPLPAAEDNINPAPPSALPPPTE